MTAKRDEFHLPNGKVVYDRTAAIAAVREDAKRDGMASVILHPVGKQPTEIIVRADGTVSE